MRLVHVNPKPLYLLKEEKKKKMKLFCQIEITSALTSAYKVHFVFKSKRVYSILLQVKFILAALFKFAE